MIGTADPSLDTPFIRPLEIVPTFSSCAPPSLPKTTRLHFLSPLWVCLQQVNWLLEVPEETSCSLKPRSLHVSGRFDFHEKVNKPNPPKNRQQTHQAASDPLWSHDLSPLPQRGFCKLRFSYSKATRNEMQASPASPPEAAAFPQPVVLISYFSSRRLF